MPEQKPGYRKRLATEIKRNHNPWNGQKKLADHQASPPPSAWNEIEKTLRQDGNSLYQHAVPPPIDSWEAIATKLCLTENTDTSRAFRWLRPALRYAAMVVFIALATTTLINNTWRNALVESIQGPGIKAALTDTPQMLIKDSSKNKIQVKKTAR